MRRLRPHALVNAILFAVVGRRAWRAERPAVPASVSTPMEAAAAPSAAARTQPPGARVPINLALLGLIAATAVVELTSAASVRPYVVLVAACFVPGGAMLTRLRTGDGLTDVALAVALSLAVEIAGSLALAWSRWWHPEALAIALGAGAAALLMADLVRVWRS